MVGQSYGRWTVLDAAPLRGKRRFWKCVCSCGTKRDVYGPNLKYGSSLSCGCLQKESAKERATKHGLSKRPEYPVWLSMNDRCNNPKNKAYSYYGGKGIKVCSRWKSFKLFLKDMGDRPSGMTLERSNNSKNYMPSNCSWESRLVQANNKSNNLIIAVNGVSKTLAQWSRDTGIKSATIRDRIKLHGWSAERAITESPK